MEKCGILLVVGSVGMFSPGAPACVAKLPSTRRVALRTGVPGADVTDCQLRSSNCRAKQTGSALVELSECVAIEYPQLVAGEIVRSHIKGVAMVDFLAAGSVIRLPRR